ncbi:Uncharacterised protein [Neisseria meningitidis]|nr:Uncharacterised protein [Neisseria meningitidis]
MCALSQCFAAYGRTCAQSKTFAFVLAVVLNVAGSKGGRLKAVFTLVFCALAVIATGTEAITYGHLCTGVLLFALIGFSILNTFYMQVARICLYAFADELRTFEGGIPAAADGGCAGRTADMDVAMCCFCLIAVVAC